MDDDVGVRRSNSCVATKIITSTDIKGNSTSICVLPTETMADSESFTNEGNVVCMLTSEEMPDVEMSNEKYHQGGCFVTSSLQSALEIIREYELSTTSAFSVQVEKHKNFGHTTFDPLQNRFIMWNEKGGKGLPFNGQPFIVLNNKYLDCAHGPERHKNYKEKLALSRAVSRNGENVPRKRKAPVQCKKLDCPAMIHLKEVIYFPDYKIRENTESRRKRMAKTLKHDLKIGTEVKQERKIIVRLPAQTDHKNHVTGEEAGVLQRIDDRLKEKIAALVSDLVTDTGEIRSYLSDFVDTVLFNGSPTPEKTNRRFYPTDSTIRNHVALTLKRLRASTIDEEQVAKVLSDCAAANPNNLVYFRPCTTTFGPECEEVRQTLLIVYQTVDQKRLIQLYGNDVCFLDATYRATNYSLPLFFVCVKTNIDYQIVGMFITECEDTSFIVEALGKLRDANPTWSPACFMTDFRERDILAVEKVFPTCRVYVCDFHREQAWNRWLSASANGISSQREEALTRLRLIADANTLEEFHSSLSELQESDLWRHEKLREWFSSVWQPFYKLWVWAFRKDAFIVGVNTDNGVECQNECLKYQYSTRKRNNTLSSFLFKLIDQFFPQRYHAYLMENITGSSEYQTYPSDVPNYLQNRPRAFVLHCTQCLEKAQKFKNNKIKEAGDKVFRVESQTNPPRHYLVSLGTEEQLPSCECRHWEKTKLLCKHFFAVFANTTFSWYDLSKLYTCSNYFRLDVDFVENFDETKSPPMIQVGCLSEKKESALIRSADCAPVEHSYSLPDLEFESIAKSDDDTNNVAVECRCLLTEVKNKTYKMKDGGVLKELRGKVEDIVKWLNDKDDEREVTVIFLSDPHKNERFF